MLGEPALFSTSKRCTWALYALCIAPGTSDLRGPARELTIADFLPTSRPACQRAGCSPGSRKLSHIGNVMRVTACTLTRAEYGGYMGRACA
jgi:hypothetical protein